ncbi:MAG: DNA-directed RNA polymerase subunit omega [Victivallaceae bacterium]
MNNAYLDRAKKQIVDPQILSIVAARRAKMLAFGARPMVKCDSENFLDVALLEIAEGLLSYTIGTNPEECEVTTTAAVNTEEAAAEVKE